MISVSEFIGLLEVPIHLINFSAPDHDTLIRAKIEKVGQLIQISKKDLALLFPARAMMSQTGVTRILTYLDLDVGLKIPKPLADMFPLHNGTKTLLAHLRKESRRRKKNRQK